MKNKETDIEYNLIRMNLWKDAWVSTANSSSCRLTETATKYADIALTEFDIRFPKNSIFPDTLNNI